MIAEVNQRFTKRLSGEKPCIDKTFVYGDGCGQNPPLMLIGEAPGKDEVSQKRPFVGKAGKNLDEFLRTLERSRDSIYISNAVKIRPTKLGKTGRESNRPPTTREIDIFTPWLIEEIKCVKPHLLVTLGNTPLRVIIGKHANIGDYHGRITDTSLGIQLYPLYHPAAVIYNRSLMDVYQQDLLRLKDILLRFLMAKDHRNSISNGFLG